MRFRVVALLAAAAPADAAARLVCGSRCAAGQGIPVPCPRARLLDAGRMQAARPRDFAFDSVRGFHPDAKPGGGGGAAAARSPAPRGRPARATRSRAPPAASCSRWAAATGSAPARSPTDTRSGYPRVLTAGHCVIESDTGEFATNWMFIPAFDLAPTYTCASDEVRLLDRRRRCRRDRVRHGRRLQRHGGHARLGLRGRGRWRQAANSTAQLDTTVGGTSRSTRAGGGAARR